LEDRISGCTFRKAEVEELLPADFSWLSTIYGKPSLSESGINPLLWQEMNKKEMLITTIEGMYPSFRTIEQSDCIDGLRWKLLVHDDSCPHCKAFEGKRCRYIDKKIPATRRARAGN